MIVQILIAIPDDTHDREAIKAGMLAAGLAIKLESQVTTDIQYREMDVPEYVVKGLLAPQL